jgi:glutathione S-transferase
MTIELYVFPPSPRAFKVMAVANHLGLDCALRVVDLSKGEQKAPDYAALNPNMRMPTLKDGDFVIWESNAIIQYLASKKPDSGLLPRDEKARLDVTRWQFWDLAHWDPAVAVFVFEYLVKPVLLGIKETDAAALAKGTEARSSLMARSSAGTQRSARCRLGKRRSPNARRGARRVPPDGYSWDGGSSGRTGQRSANSIAGAARIALAPSDSTARWASASPAPYCSSNPFGPRSNAVDCRTLRTSSGVMAGRISIRRAAIPLTSAAATDVPVDSW